MAILLENSVKHELRNDALLRNFGHFLVHEQHLDSFMVMENLVKVGTIIDQRYASIHGKRRFSLEEAHRNSDEVYDLIRMLRPVKKGI